MAILPFITRTIQICLRVFIPMSVVLVLTVAMGNVMAPRHFTPINQPEQVPTLIVIKLQEIFMIMTGLLAMEHSIFAKCTHISLMVARPDILKLCKNNQPNKKPRGLTPLGYF